MRIIAIIGFSEQHVGLLPNFAAPVVGIVDCRIKARTLDLPLFVAPAVGVANCVLRVAGGFTAYICGS